MWHSIIAYLKYRLLAKSKYSIHSPFVFDLITKGLENPVNSSHIRKLESYRNDLFNDTTSIKITDFGAGSKIFTSNDRKVSDIAKIAGIKPKKVKLLLQLITYFKPKSILEIGTSLGIGSASMSIAAPKTKIITLEGCPETAKKAQEYFSKHQLNNINSKVGEFSNLLPEILENNSFDIIYFDGNHQKEATINYFEQSLQSLHNDSLLIFDDIHWSQGMEEAWRFITNHSKTKVSIDLFEFGLVFLRKEQVKQNFILKVN